MRMASFASDFTTRATFRHDLEIGALWFLRPITDRLYVFRRQLRTRMQWRVGAERHGPILPLRNSVSITVSLCVVTAPEKFK